MVSILEGESGRVIGSRLKGVSVRWGYGFYIGYGGKWGYKGE